MTIIGHKTFDFNALKKANEELKSHFERKKEMQKKAQEGWGRVVYWIKCFLFGPVRRCDNEARRILFQLDQVLNIQKKEPLSTRAFRWAKEFLFGKESLCRRIADKALFILDEPLKKEEFQNVFNFLETIQDYAMSKDQKYIKQKRKEKISLYNLWLKTTEPPKNSQRVNSEFKNFFNERKRNLSESKSQKKEPLTSLSSLESTSHLQERSVSSVNKKEGLAPLVISNEDSINGGEELSPKPVTKEQIDAIEFNAAKVRQGGGSKHQPVSHSPERKENNGSGPTHHPRSSSHSPDKTLTKRKSSGKTVSFDEKASSTVQEEKKVQESVENSPEEKFGNFIQKLQNQIKAKLNELKTNINKDIDDAKKIESQLEEQGNSKVVALLSKTKKDSRTSAKEPSRKSYQNNLKTLENHVEFLKCIFKDKGEAFDKNFKPFKVERVGHFVKNMINVSELLNSIAEEVEEACKQLLKDKVQLEKVFQDLVNNSQHVAFPDIELAEELKTLLSFNTKEKLA